ncbi:hypothetical protein UA08_04962 [Talaromyces atroroseus]|uniref:Ecp2 effector protein domain-containing protein n=1 Tax=Talaromyces atroroseus TaxID=1441469 RepID=A0A225AF22_TALAT|nr:hypothetical protein UA08_04962 [Talaromyces atroroseus]OKL59902.1 hypothetical protein UA08_04962 [Talaromyces atroroseus]
MYNFGQILSISALLLASATASNVTTKRWETTACCEEMTDCTTLSGEQDGLKWCVGYFEGNTEWTQGDSDATQCLTYLHYTQDDKCISKSGSRCDTGGDSPNVAIVDDGFWYGDYQLSSADMSAINAAIQALVGTGIDMSTSQAGDLGTLVFAHVADNGSGINSIEVFNSGSC